MLASSSCEAWAASAEEANFLRSINDQGQGKDFSQAILLSDTASYEACDTFDCAEKTFNDTVFQNEIKYVAQEFGRPRQDWDLLGEGEVAAYIFGNSRYYDDLSIQEIATGKKRVLHFDITSAVDALKKKEYSIDSSAASDKWDPVFFY